MVRKISRYGALAAMILALVACGKKDAKGSGSGSGGKGPAVKQENTPASLLGLVKQIRKAQQDGNMSLAAKLTRELLPTEKRLKKALKDGVPPEQVAKMMRMHKMFGEAPDKLVAGLLRNKPEQKEIQIHGATTEVIAAYKPGSVAFKEFPGGAKKLARTILRPGTTFYEVEFLEPGNTRGMKYHLFFWDGARWTMLGPMWRALR